LYNALYRTFFSFDNAVASVLGACGDGAVAPVDTEDIGRWVAAVLAHKNREQVNKTFALIGPAPQIMEFQADYRDMSPEQRAQTLVLGWMVSLLRSSR
jgi:uncharacterized protein YbjT (DUF2867 family)